MGSSPGTLVAALLGYRTLYYLVPLLLAVLVYLILEKRAKAMRRREACLGLTRAIGSGGQMRSAVLKPMLILMMASLLSGQALAEACNVLTRSSSEAVTPVERHSCYSYSNLPAEAINWSCSNESKDMLNSEKQGRALCRWQRWQLHRAIDPGGIGQPQGNWR